MRSITIRERVLAVAAAMALTLPLAAAGDAVVTGDEVPVEKTFEQEILDILRSDGKIDEQQYKDLKAKAEAERAAEARAAAAAAEDAAEAKAAAAAAAAKTPAVSAEGENPKGFKVKYSNGLQFNRNDGNIKVKLGGRIQADFASIWPSNSLAAIGPEYAGKEAVEFRRARLYVSGELYKRLIFKAQYDFAGGDADFKDVYIGLKNLGYAGTVKVGHQKEPFSLEELTSSKYITFMERSLPSVFDSERNFGLSAQNHVLDQRMTYAAGIYAPTDGFGDWESFDTEFNVTGRVTGLPWYEEEGRKLVHLGIAGSYQYRDGVEESISQRPEAHLAEKYVETDDFDSDGNTLMAAEVAFVYGPWSLQSEWKQNWIKVTGQQTASMMGTYVYGSYFITGENRNYKTKTGTFGRVSPKSPFNPMKNQWGAWEVAARYSWLDLNSKSIRGGEEQDVTAGLNWYMWSNFRIMLNYIWADVKDTGDVLGNRNGNINIVQARASLEF